MFGPITYFRRRSASALLLALCVLTAEAQTLERIDLSDRSSFAASDGWQQAGDASALWSDDALTIEDGSGVLVALQGGDLVTSWEHGDLILELEFMTAAGTESALVLQGKYELQLSDSWGARHPTIEDAGAVSPPAGGGALEGHVPRVNAAKAPGLWQQLRVVFEAPRFEGDRKVTNARFDEVILNGVKVQESVQVAGPTAGGHDESSSGPLIITGGPLAIRNLHIRHFEPVEPVRLSDVRYTLYEGEFSSLEEFDEPAAEGEAFGYVWDLFGPTADRIGLEWEGMIHVPRTGEYDFAMRFNWIDEIPYEEDAVAGRGRFTIDGREVIEHDGADSTAFGRVHLEEGTYPFRFAYFKNRRLWRPIVFLRVQGPDMPEQYLNAHRTLPQPESTFPPVPVAVGGEPYVLRSFAEYGGEKKTNVVSVGDPSGLHYALDLNTGAMLAAWRGAFVDVGSMWTSRGERQTAVPLGQLTRVSDRPIIGGSRSEESEMSFEEYRLDAAGYPTFRYTVAGFSISDAVAPDGNKLRRRLTLKPLDGGAADACALVARGENVTELEEGIYAVDGRFFVDLSDAKALTRSSDRGTELIVPISPGDEPTQIAYNIIW